MTGTQLDQWKLLDSKCKKVYSTYVKEQEALRDRSRTSWHKWLETEDKKFGKDYHGSVMAFWIQWHKAHRECAENIKGKFNELKND